MLHILDICYTNFSLYSSFYNSESYTNFDHMINKQTIAIQNVQMNLHPDAFKYAKSHGFI